MNQEIKQRWIEALRSNEYQQDINRLKTTKGFCCLGVLCDLHRKETDGKWEGSYYQNVSTSIPLEVLKWSGLSSVDPVIGNKSLTEYNDNLKYNFNQIADLIEEGL